MNEAATTPATPKRKEVRPSSGKSGPATDADWLSAAGLSAWASRMATSPDSVLAAVSAILAGTAGGGWCATFWGHRQLAKLDLIVPDPLGRSERAPPTLPTDRIFSRAIWNWIPGNVAGKRWRGPRSCWREPGRMNCEALLKPVTGRRRWWCRCASPTAVATAGHAGMSPPVAACVLPGWLPNA